MLLPGSLMEVWLLIISHNFDIVALMCEFKNLPIKFAYILIFLLKMY